MVKKLLVFLCMFSGVVFGGTPTLGPAQKAFEKVNALHMNTEDGLEDPVSRISHGSPDSFLSRRDNLEAMQHRYHYSILCQMPSGQDRAFVNYFNQYQYLLTSRYLTGLQKNRLALRLGLSYRQIQEYEQSAEYFKLFFSSNYSEVFDQILNLEKLRIIKYTYVTMVLTFKSLANYPNIHKFYTQLIEHGTSLQQHKLRLGLVVHACTNVESYEQPDRSRLDIYNAARRVLTGHQFTTRNDFQKEQISDLLRYLDKKINELERDDSESSEEPVLKR